MLFCIADEKLLEKYMIEDFKNIELNALLVYDDRYKNQNRNIQQQ